MKSPLRVMLVLGTRPEVTKLAPLARELRAYPKQFHTLLVSTGQHRELVPQYLRFFELEADYDLKVMKPRQSLADITARTVARMDALLGQERPQVVVVQGDTTAVFAASLAAFYHHVPVAHVEAGLRSGDRYDPFPEEMNRRLVSPLAELNFAPTVQARQNLLREGVAPESIYITGNTAVDALLYTLKRRPAQPAFPAEELKGKRLLLVTAHRRENWGEGLRNICLALADLAGPFPGRGGGLSRASQSDRAGDGPGGAGREGAGASPRAAGLRGPGGIDGPRHAPPHRFRGHSRGGAHAREAHSGPPQDHGTAGGGGGGSRAAGRDEA